MKKSPPLICFVLTSAVFWFAGCRDAESDRTVELLRKREIEASRARAKAVAPQPEDFLAFKLSQQVIAERDEASDAWYVSQPDSKSFLKLPFQPPVSGAYHAKTITEVLSKKSFVDSNPGFLGAAVCAECHQEKHAGFIGTAHHQTSGWMPVGGGGEQSVRGQYANGVVDIGSGSLTAAMRPDVLSAESTDLSEVGEDVNKSSQSFDTEAFAATEMGSKDPALRFQMLQDPTGYFQEISIADYRLKLPVHVFTGSSKAGQTFLYWHKNRLYQSFVSYLTDLDQWIPSPGYYDTTADYSREIGTTCLECHITYIDRGNEPGTLKPDTAVWGISCERCHGPGQSHVEYHREFTTDRVAKHIVHPNELSRQRQLDICSQCHSGNESLMTGKFDFRPGMEVSKRRGDPSSRDVGGVHTANQLNRLSMSRCFEASEMTCTTCHDPHADQRGQRAIFSQSCLKCHQSGHCGLSDQLGASISDNCIDCHMPTGDNDQMTIEIAGGGVFTVSMIDHHIRVDAEATEVFLDSKSKSSE